MLIRSSKMVPFVLVLLHLMVRSAQTSSAVGAADVTPIGPDWIATAGATTKTVCSLSMQGNGDKPGLKAVQLSCTGGTVTAQAHKLLKQLWGSSLPKQGVAWTEDKSCRPVPGCLLAICGKSDAVFVNAQVTGVRTAPGPLIEQGGVALCVSRGSRVTLRNCSISSSTITPLIAYGNTTSVLLEQCNISNINNTLVWGDSGVSLYNATVVVRSSNFTQNAAPKRLVSTLSAAGAGRLAILDSTFTGNTGDVGGALYASNTTQVTIQGCRFEGNKANFGGAMFAHGEASIAILPGTQTKGTRTVFLNNTAADSGGDICLSSTAAARITGAALAEGKAKNGGSIALDGNSTMDVVNATIQGGQSVAFGGCVRLSQNSSLRMRGSEVSGCTADPNGGGIHVKDAARVVLINSTISSNVARRRNNGTSSGYGGGIIAADASEVVLQGATIYNNTATREAGGLGLYEDATLVVVGPVKTRMINNTVKGNSLAVGGGLRLATTNFNPTQLAELLVIENNFALVGPNIAIQSTNVTVVDEGEAGNVIASDTKESTLVLMLNVSGPHGLPSEDHLAYSTEADVGGAGRYIMVGTTTEANNLRRLELKFKDPPGTYRLQINSVTGRGRAQLNVTIIPCPKGYVTGGRDDTCNPCPQGLYSFNATDATCSLCPADAQCPGLGVVWPEAGFWQSAPQSVHMHRCYNREACLGATTLNATASNQSAARQLLNATLDGKFKTAQCAKPYQGNLCGECKPGWGKVRPFLCRKCMSGGAIVVLYVTAAFAMVAMVKLLVHLSTSADLAPRIDPQVPIPAELLRALVVHAQWLYIISMMVGVRWPATLAWPLQVIGGIWSSTSGSSIGFDCILQGSKGLPAAAQKLLICLLTPAGILCAVLVIEAVMHYLRPRKSANAGHDIASVVMCIVFMFLPTWANTALSLFTCVPLDKPVEAPYQAEAVGSWWVEDMSQLCYSRSGYHRGWALGLGIPLTLLFCVALPAGVFVFMWYSRKQGKLQDMQFQKHYGFMYRLWRDEWCWWEAVMLLQTCALVMVSSFGFALGPFYQGILSATVLACVGMLLLAVKPFKCPAAGRIAVLSVCVLFFTAQAALTFIPYNSTSPPAAYGNVMGVVLLLANVAFLVGTTWKLVTVVDWASVKGIKHLPAFFRCCSNTPNKSMSLRPQQEA